MSSQTRRVSDGRSNVEQRNQPAHAMNPSRVEIPRYRFPSWDEQRTQFIARFLVLALGTIFYNLVPEIEPVYSTLTQLNTALGIYFIVATIFFIHARKHHFYPQRYHAAMWADILMVSIAMLNDPYPITPSLLVFIMVVLGNGMRYGMRMFGEALVVSFVAITIVFWLRFSITTIMPSPGLIFLNVFGSFILIYSYILMGRIEESRNELERNSNLDTLTGLLNRRALQSSAKFLFQRLKNRRDRIFVMMFADLDKFKDVNDNFGHAAGDLVLKHFADILRTSIRDTDVAARFGGDEFVVLLEDTNIKDAEPIARRIQSQVNRWATENGIDFSVTFGLGEAPTHGDSYSSLLERVDQALYKSKSDISSNGMALASPT